MDAVAEAVLERSRAGKHFSIVAVAEGAMTVGQADTVRDLLKQKQKAPSKAAKTEASEQLDSFHRQHVNNTLSLTEDLEKRTGLESRLTILGHLQRGGAPSAADRILATKLGTACAELLHDKAYGMMVAARGNGTEAMPLKEVAGKKKLVPPDDPLVESARLVGTSFGDS